MLSWLVVLCFSSRSVTAGDTSLITFSHLNHPAHRIIDFLFLSFARLYEGCLCCSSINVRLAQSSESVFFCGANTCTRVRVFFPNPRTGCGALTPNGCTQEPADKNHE